MPEPRQQQYHRERMAVAIREEITTIVEGELRDPRLMSASVTDVQLMPGGKSARVFFTVHGEEEDARRAAEGLAAAKGYIRRELIERLGLRQAPELIFQLDRSQQYSARIEELLRRTGKRKR